MEALDSKKELAKKLLKIMKSLNPLEKTGLNTFHKYKYVEEAYVANVIRPLLVEHGVFVFQSVIREEKLDSLTKVTVEYTFVDSDSGQNHTVNSVGYGIDGQDKGIYKALTGAHKYFLIKNFNLGSDVDPEDDDVAGKKAKDITAKVTNGTQPVQNKASAPLTKPVVTIPLCDLCSGEMKVSKSGAGYYCPNFKDTTLGEHSRFKKADLHEYIKNQEGLRALT